MHDGFGNYPNVPLMMRRTVKTVQFALKWRRLGGVREASVRGQSTLKNFMAIIAMNSYSWNMVSLTVVKPCQCMIVLESVYQNTRRETCSDQPRFGNY